MLSLKAGSRYWHNREYKTADIVFILENSPLFFLSWRSEKKVYKYSEILKRGIGLKNRKCNLYITGGIAIVGIIGLVILQLRCYELIGIYGGTTFLSDLRQLGIAIMGGLFTSACVTFLISIGEYKNERTEALENLYFAVEDLEREFSKITYFLPDEPKELVSNLLGELDNNEQNRKFNKMLSEAVAQFKNQQEADEVYEQNCRKLEYDAQNAFRDYIWEHTDERTKEVCREPFQIKEYLDKECAEKIKIYREQLENSMKSFLRFQKVRTHDIADAYKRLDFLFANKSIRRHIHEKLYCRFWEEVKLIKIVGTALAYVAPVIWGLMESSIGRVPAMRVTFAILGVIAFICMQVPVFAIKEKEYVNSQPAEGTAFSSLVKTFKNREFCIFVGSDIFYWIGLTMFQTGLPFFVTSLLGLSENMSTIFFVAMTALSLVFYVPVNLLTKKFGKRNLVLTAFLIFAICFGYTALMGEGLIIPPVVQGFILVVAAAFPMAIFGILPQAMVADISESDARKTGENREGMFYAARTFAFKLGQSVSMLLFTALVTIGSGGNGYRVVAAVSCALALIGGIIRFSARKELQHPPLQILPGRQSLARLLCTAILETRRTWS